MHGRGVHEMRIGFNLPQFGSHAHHPEGVAKFARRAEEMGADSLWVGDRLLAPLEPEVNYPGTTAFPAEFRAGLDPFAALTVAAVVTTRPLLGSSVLVAPWYAPPLLARSLATIDQLSGGRVIAGLGAGWSPEEFRAVGVPMGERGSRFDECLDALAAYWGTNPVEHHGRFWTTAAGYVDVKPVQRPGPPVYLAAFTPAGMTRVGRRADGFLPAVTPGPFEPTIVTGPMSRIRAAAARAGRDPHELGVILRVNTMAGDSVHGIAEVVLRARDEAAVDHAFVDLTYRDLATSVEHAVDLAGRVLDLVRAR
ncbi:TIGR03619 family F420-dependent LLM class oxidoreductase [Pseudonocardia xinjiangensis]|uniref:TIGR03619 family F420-dependent LLM class oxidoreductase n=1 Tax=Pseudonocardia xinjiangensis TaxID=75289 RepID=UPI003D8A932F